MNRSPSFAHRQALVVAIVFALGATDAFAQSSTEYGTNAVASGFWASAFGDGAEATGTYTTAIGGGAYAYGYESTAVGFLSEARAENSSAFGAGALAFGQGTTALGTWAFAGGGFDWSAPGGRPGNIVEIVNGTAVGFSASAAANGATALGANAKARGVDSVAIGNGAKVTPPTPGADIANSVAIGAGSTVSNFNDVAIGNQNIIQGQSSTAIGDRNTITATAKTDAVQILGNRNTVDSASSVNIQGTFNRANQSYWSTLSGFSNRVQNAGAVNITGVGNQVTSDSVYSNGNTNAWDPTAWTAVNVAGNGNMLTSTTHATVFGNLNAITGGAENVVFGDGYALAGSTGNFLAGYRNTIGAGVNASQILGNDVVIAAGISNAVALGDAAQVSASNTLALGDNTQVSAANAVALGSGSIADEADTVSVGSAGAERMIVNVAPARLSATSTDAVNGSQLFNNLTAVAESFGGGAAMTASGFTGPTYAIQGSNYFDVGSALAALDGKVSLLSRESPVAPPSLDGFTNDANGIPKVASAAGGTALGVNAEIPTGATNGVAIGESASVTQSGGTALGQGATVTAEGAVALGQGSLADRADTVSVGSAGNERQISNVAAGTQDTDAVNKSQLDDGVASANQYTDAQVSEGVATANRYTDTQIGSRVSSANQYADARINALADDFTAFRKDVDQRFRHQDERIDRQGAMNAAMLNMAVSAAGVHTPNRLGVGIGFQSGETALSVGYQRAISDRATVTVGGAFSSDESSIGVGAGFGW